MEELLPHLKHYRIVLGSGSPRRSELLTGLGLKFTTRVSHANEEISSDWEDSSIAEELAKLKAEALRSKLSEDELLITADTVVVTDYGVLNKPADESDARRMLELLSGKTHKVYTGVCLATRQKMVHFSDCTIVQFCKLESSEIAHYIQNYAPFDKAGSYGAQDFIGLMGIERLEGSYFNVMGLPTHRLFEELKNFC
jgi:septum formation protein